MERGSPPGTRRTLPSLEGLRVPTENEVPPGRAPDCCGSHSACASRGTLPARIPGKCGRGLRVLRVLRGSGSTGTPGRDCGRSPLPLTAVSLPCCEPAAGGVPGSRLRMSALVPCN